MDPATPPATPPTRLTDRERIAQLVSTPCPKDFPRKLRPYWRGMAEFSRTPVMTAWGLYYRDRDLARPDAA